MVLIGCGSSGGSGGAGGAGSGGSGGSGNCSITISGATSATLACTATSVYDVSHNEGSVSLGVSNPAPLGAVTVVITRSGDVMTGMWSNTDQGAQSGVDVLGTGMPAPAWVAAAGQNSQGSYTMNLTSASLITQSANGKAYTVHGTLEATALPIPGSGATGNLMVQATF